MIRHVAVFRFVPEFTTERAGALDVAPAGAAGSRSRELRSMSVGPDVLGGPSSHELAIVADFDDLDGLDAYNAASGPRRGAEDLRPVKASLATVDFEIPDAP